MKAPASSSNLPHSMNALAPDTEGSLQDEAILSQIANTGSSRALEDLYKRHHRMLRSVALRIVHDEAAADDVLQDVFIQIWNQANTYSPEKGQVLGWLIILTRRRALDRVRQRSAYQRATDRFEMEHERRFLESEDNCTVETDVCSNDLRSLMVSLMSHLPEAQQEVVKLAYFEDMSQREIAAHLQLPLGTVKTRIELGMRKLGTSLAPIRSKVC
ncbi:MAG: sigma70-ECF: polymerase sigma factor, sigma-70 family [Verrucomicrobiaceae bacterium]|nr:sigma70-ECF: polymerase sigma factor, sigma-70 family [Verrucomicrobiaceae bacterium]